MSSSNAAISMHGSLQSAQSREPLLTDELDEASSGISLQDIPLVADDDAGEEEYLNTGISSPVNPEGSQPSGSGLAQPSSGLTSPASLRPNKFHGPPSTWRSWTAADRAISDSLDQLKAEDLSVHLFNAHALKKRIGNVKPEEEDEDYQQRRADTWQPPKIWTAWPMCIEDVPRGQTRSSEVDLDNEHIRQLLNKQLRPSQELEDSLSAIILKEAKERFLNRRCWDESSDTGASIDTEEEGRSTRKDGQSRQESSPGALNLKPVVLADDDHAQRVLRPTVRQQLIKVDELFMGLHYARQAYLCTADNTQSETQTDADNDRHSVERKSNGRSSSKRGRPRKGDPKSSDPTSSRGSSLARPKKRPRPVSPASRARRMRDGQLRLGLRDWSDVLGVASMQGWNPSVIKRTADRCATLFGEGIKFRILHEGKHASIETYCLPKSPAQPEVSQSSERHREPTTNEELSQGSSIKRSSRSANGKLYCPMPTCPRSERGFEREWNFQEHMKNKHGSHQSLANSEDSEGDMYGAVHVDGFLKPIRAQKGWRGKTMRKKKHADGL